MKKRSVLSFIVSLLIVLGLVLGALFFLNNTVNETPDKEDVFVTIPTLKDALEKKRFLHISDLNSEHFGKEQEGLKKLIEGQRYAAVFFTGDMLGKRNDPTAFAELLRVFPKDTAMFFIAGDDDPPVFENGDYAPWIRYLESFGVKYLDSPELIKSGKERIWVCPFDILLMDLKESRKSYEKTLSKAQDDSDPIQLKLAQKRLSIIERAERAQLEMLSTDSYICLSHIPLGESDLSLIYDLKSEETKLKNFPGVLSLILSGHFNNGQWHLPFVGPLFKPEHELFSEYGILAKHKKLSGFLQVRGIAQHISPGLSTSSIYPAYASFRLFNRPMISYVILTQNLR